MLRCCGEPTVGAKSVPAFRGRPAALIAAVFIESQDVISILGQ